MSQLAARMSARSQGLYVDERSVDVFVDQVLRVCDLGCEWLFVLEDDVRVLSPITRSLEFDLNGFNPHVRLPREVHLELLKSWRRPFFGGYGGCGGSIIRTNVLRKRPEEATRRFLRRVILRARRPFGSDEILSSWVLFNGVTIGGYVGFAETWYPNYRALLEAGVVSVVHSYKDDYS